MAVFLQTSRGGSAGEHDLSSAIRLLLLSVHAERRDETIPTRDRGERDWLDRHSVGPVVVKKCLAVLVVGMLLVCCWHEQTLNEQGRT